jgi:hypothetical protein
VRDTLGLDLRLAVGTDAHERRVLAEGMMLRNPVDGCRGDEHGPADSHLQGGGEGDAGSVDVRRADRIARGLDRQRGRGVYEHVGAVD